jgi:hypothetical protein
MSDQIVPLTTSPLQTFEIPLSVGTQTVRLNLTIRYNEMAGYWAMDVANQFGIAMLTSVPLITGTWPAANILGQFQYLNIGSAFVINVGNNPNDYPDQTSLGNDFILIWSDPT